MNPTQSVFIESQKISDVLSIANQNTLVIFDVNQTLIHSCFSPNGETSLTPELLSKETQQSLLKEAVSKNVEAILSIVQTEEREQKKVRAYLEKRITNIITKKVYGGQYWENLTARGSTISVEEDTAQTIHRLQEQHIPTMAFTAKERKAVEFLTQSLQSVDISFTKGPFSDIKLSKKCTETEPGFWFENGILFTRREKKASFTKIDTKGNLLVSFLKRLPVHPKPEKFIFVDNRKELVQDVIDECNRNDIQITGIWYNSECTKVVQKGEHSPTPPSSPEVGDWWLLKSDRLKKVMSSLDLPKARDTPEGASSADLRKVKSSPELARKKR